MILKQCLLCVSLGLFLVEVILFFFIKNQPRDGVESDPILDQFAQLLDILKPRHYFMYSAIYFFLLFLAKFWVYLFLFIITIQIISLMVDCVIYFKLKRFNR